MTSPDDVLRLLEHYYDTVPRRVATTDECGPFTIFVPTAETAWSFYARPRLGLDTEVTGADVRRLLARQDELGVPQNLEWVDEVTPSLLPAVAEVLGDRTERYPLLVRRDATAVVAAEGTVLLTPDHPDLAAVIGAIDAAFGGRDDPHPATLAAQPGLLADGALIMVGAYAGDGTVVGGGSTSPRGDVAELMGIGVLPRARNAGHGTAVTQALVAAALDAGVSTVFLSAGSDGAASIYRRIGFEDVGTACILEVGDE